MLKVGVVGAGWVATNRHIPSFIRDNRVRVLGLACPSLETVKKVSQKFGIKKFYTSIDELLKQELDIVDICTPPFTHHEMVIKAAEAGCNILVEKPFAMNSKEAEEMIAAAKRYDVKLSVCHNFLYSISMKRIKMLHESGRLGQLTGAIAFQMSNLKRRLPTWYPSLPGGLFFDESPHMVYSIIEFLGDVSVKWARTVSASGKQPLNCVEAALVSKSNGASSYLRFTFNAPRDEWILTFLGTKRAVMVDFFRDTLIEIGEGGTHTPFEVFGNSLSFIWQASKETLKSGFRFLSGRLYFGHDELIRLFINSVVNDTEPPQPGEKGKKVIEIIEQILEKGGAF
ncbi:MAG: Gfo/Idh/MocA family protein [Candidatus Baldrarchaeia archaeon]